MIRSCVACQSQPALNHPKELLCAQCSVDLDIWIDEVLAGDEEPA